jgi:hypothetical protein
MIYKEEKVMRKIMLKTICVLTLVFFIMSIAGTACSNIVNKKCITNAKGDTFTCKSKSCCYDTLKNDKGCNLKVTSTGCSPTRHGGKVCMQSNGKFCYTKPANYGSEIDSFKYCIKGADKKTDCTDVKINNK